MSDDYIQPDRNKVRRAAYRASSVAQEHKRADERARYNRNNEKTARPPAQPTLLRGKRREVHTEDMDTPRTVETYTIAEAAESLGKSLNAVRRWIADDMIPAPYLRDTSTNYQVYSRGELEIIAQALRQHAVEYSYFRADHQSTIHEIHQRVQGFRATSI